MYPEAWARYRERVDLFRATHPDWDAVTDKPIPMHRCVQAEILTKINGPAICYFLGNNPTIASLLGQASPGMACMAINELSNALMGGVDCGAKTPGAVN